MAGLLEGKTGVVVGVANKRSIAWAIAKAMHGEGARLVFSYLDERLEGRVRELAAELPGEPSPVLKLDVQKDAELDTFFADAAKALGGGIDALVHSVAFAQREDLAGQFLDTSREGFRIALDVSAYSLAACAKRAAPFLRDGASLLTLSYLGAERVLPGYNVMGVAKAALEASVRYLAADLGPKGVRVNAISAGPINTLSARGITGFTGIIDEYAKRAPLRRGTEPEEVADAALFFLSRMGRGVTGEVLYVDAGYHIMGL